MLSAQARLQVSLFELSQRSPMLYSLLSRYQGALCATALARGTIDRLQSTDLSEREWHNLDGWVTINPTYGNARALPGAMVEALIQQGQAGLEIFFADRCWQPANELDRWMALIPLALFFHEDHARWQQSLGKLATGLQLPSTLIDGAGVVGYAIARALDDTLDPATLIPQTLNHLKLSKAKPELGQQLATVQTLLDLGASLEETRILFARRRSIHFQNLTDDAIAIALAFYCFLSTPEDLRLSVLRSLRLQDRSPLVTVVTAALSGTYNAYGSIPAQWRMATDDQIRKLSLRLYAAWAGVCDASQIPSEWGLPAVAAPRK
jgi:ADP-ribosylglycohydrolase